MAFLEERISEQFAFGSSVVERYAVGITQTKDGSEYRRLLHPYPSLIIEAGFNNRTETFLYANIVDMYQRSGGLFGGFRWKNPNDYTTNGRKTAPTYNDQACVASGSDYQIVKWYGTEGGSDATRRLIKKPVAGSVVVGIRDDFGSPTQITNSVSPQRWVVDTTTGLITFKANNQKTITNITQATEAVITVGGGHGYIAGDYVHISGVSGMTEINGQRATIQSVGGSTITVDINSSGYTAFSTASPNLAVANTAPQSTETVTSGCEFDIPVRFDTELSGDFITKNSSDVVMSTSVRLIEILNP